MNIKDIVSVVLQEVEDEGEVQHGINNILDTLKDEGGAEVHEGRKEAGKEGVVR